MMKRAEKREGRKSAEEGLAEGIAARDCGGENVRKSK